jgi:hypothetical protein
MTTECMISTLNTTIREAIAHDPQLYKYGRASVLDHLFFTIGNGFEWCHGMLVSNGVARRLERIAEPKFLDVFPKLTIPSNAAQYDKLKQLAQSLTIDKHFSIYPLSLEHSRIARIPDNVRPDWLHGAFEAIALGKRWVELIRAIDTEETRAELQKDEWELAETIIVHHNLESYQRISIALEHVEQQLRQRFAEAVPSAANLAS